MDKDTEAILENLKRWFLTQGRTLGLAESCTGGFYPLGSPVAQGLLNFFKGPLFLMPDRSKRIFSASRDPCFNALERSVRQWL